MKFSTKTEYGLRAMVQLAKNYGKKPISLASIAKAEKISQPYLERLVAGLKLANLVQSTKGVNGGYGLLKSPSRISLFEIVEALEGPIAIYSCLAEDIKVSCCRKSCLTKKVWLKVQDRVVRVLKQAKLSELI